MAELSLRQIEEKLNTEFSNENSRLIFWYDDNSDFVDDIDHIKLQNAKVYHLAENNQFAAKVFLEREDTEGKYLIYAPFPKPSVLKNHLEDMLLYSKRFYADRISLICADLHLDDDVKDVLLKYRKYFAAKDRAQRFCELSLDDSSEDTIKLALISCICKLRVASFEEVLCKVLLAEDLEHNVYLEELAKYDLLDAFWEQCELHFGFSALEKSLEKLVISLFVTYIYKNIYSEMPETWRALLCTKQGSVIAFLEGFMNNVLYKDRFDKLSEDVADKLQIQKFFENTDVDILLNIDVFKDADRIILKWLVERLVLEDLTANINTIGIKEICDLRSKMHFAAYTKKYYGMCKSAYEVISAAGFMPANNFKDILQAYTGKDYKIDFWYRQFYTFLDQLEELTAFAKLIELVENVYNNEYLGRLLPAWNNNLESGILNADNLQVDFYKRFIQNERDRIVVIISDGLRYEVAAQLQNILTDEERCKECYLQAQLAPLPSNTALGMAALLPHKIISYNNDYKVLVDDKKCASLAEREKILQSASVASKCVQFDDLKKMKREELRNIFANQQVIYIYHNQIDARGDSLKSQDEVFKACEEAISEIYTLMCRLAVNVSVVKYIVTADHGFIYRRKSINEYEKSSVKGNYGIINHRFLVGEKPCNDYGTGNIKIGAVLKNNDERYVSYTLGAQVFKSAGGGVNYVHGGSSPQEMIVPILSVRMEKGHTEIKQATIKLHTLTNKVTSKEINLAFIQTEPVSDVVKSATYKLSFVDENGKAVSNEIILEADSKNADLSKRTTMVRFSFINTEYSNKNHYYLVIKDMNDFEVERINFIIDMPFVGDFGFDF